MECNKDEAIRAKEIAKNKMENKDFVGAQKVLLRAQRLYQDLENVSQMLTVCEVHCSAEQKFGSDCDWYRILQVERTADEISIKKQYRKLALVLHPDKNKFAGAEAAFKLIGEAQRVLTDQMKRNSFDMKLKGYMRTDIMKPPPKPQNRKHTSSKQPGVQNVFVNGANPESASFIPQQQLQQQQQAIQSFWTMCPSCHVRYQYIKEVLNKVVCCQNCKGHFMARSFDSQVWPPETSNNQPAQQKVFPVHAHVKVGQHMGFQGNFSGAATAAKPFSSTEHGVGIGSNTNAKDNNGVNMGGRKKAENVPKFTTAKSKIGKPSERTNMKREWSDDSNTGSGIDTKTGEATKDNGHPFVDQNTGFTGQRSPRRSPRKKQNNIPNEDVGNNDKVMNPVKRAKTVSSNASEQHTTNDKQEKGKEDSEIYKQQWGSPSERSFSNGNDGGEKLERNETEPSSRDYSSKSNKSANIKPEPEFVDYPDPDFNDFDKERAQDIFAADQVWAIYDTADGMPRFYARIRKVNTPRFKLRITWLEPVLKRQDEIDWFNEDFPVACGKFKFGKSESTEDHLMFSHLISWEKGTSKCPYMIYPRKGETWALFKNWDISWKSDPDNHRKYVFEFVEVISDYAENQDYKIVYLVKMERFRCLFKQTSKTGVVPANELLRFSHRIPSFRMSGMEKGVPEGSLELDPASFYVNLESSPDQEDCKEKIGGNDSDLNYSGTKCRVEEVGSSLKETVRPSMPKVVIDLDEAIHEVPKCRDEFPVESNGNNEKNLPSQSPSPIKEEISKHPFSLNDDYVDNAFKPVDESNTPEPVEVPEAIFYNFDSNRSLEKFKPGQVWAIYSDDDGFPKYYAQISKVEWSPDFKVHVTWLVACSTSKNILQWSEEDMPVGCGVFRLAVGENMVYTRVTPFSHQVRIESSGRNKYKIFPRKGEVWAVFRDFNTKWTCSELAKCDYDFVEILEDEEFEMKALVLKQVDGFKTIFTAQEIGGSKATMKISRYEMLRFSHQVPAFLLFDESNGCLKGCWELDPASLPVHYLC